MREKGILSNKDRSQVELDEIYKSTLGFNHINICQFSIVFHSVHLLINKIEFFSA